MPHASNGTGAQPPSGARLLLPVAAALSARALGPRGLLTAASALSARSHRQGHSICIYKECLFMGMHRNAVQFSRRGYSRIISAGLYVEAQRQQEKLPLSARLPPRFIILTVGRFVLDSKAEMAFTQNLSRYLPQQAQLHPTTEALQEIRRDPRPPPDLSIRSPVY